MNIRPLSDLELVCKYSLREVELRKQFFSKLPVSAPKPDLDSPIGANNSASIYAYLHYGQCVCVDRGIVGYEF